MYNDTTKRCLIECAPTPNASISHTPMNQDDVPIVTLGTKFTPSWDYLKTCGRKSQMNCIISHPMIMTCGYIICTFIIAYNILQRLLNVLNPTLSRTTVTGLTHI